MYIISKISKNEPFYLSNVLTFELSKKVQSKVSPVPVRKPSWFCSCFIALLWPNISNLLKSFLIIFFFWGCGGSLFYSPYLLSLSNFMFNGLKFFYQVQFAFLAQYKTDAKGKFWIFIYQGINSQTFFYIVQLLCSWKVFFIVVAFNQQ